TGFGRTKLSDVDCPTAPFEELFWLRHGCADDANTARIAANCNACTEILRRERVHLVSDGNWQSGGIASMSSPYLNSERPSASLPAVGSGFWPACVGSVFDGGLSAFDQGVNFEINRLPSESFCATFVLPVGLSNSYGVLDAANVSASTHLTVGRAARSAAF